MLDEHEIVRHCDSRVLRCARNIMHARDAVFARSCKYDSGSSARAQLRAQVKSSQDWRTGYDVIIDVDFEKSRVRDYDCTCPASLHYSGMCKHTVATALSFLESPSSFIGYEASHKASSSRALVAALAAIGNMRLDTQGDDAGEQLVYDDEHRTSRNQAVHEGRNIGLELTLVLDVVGWLARFSVSGHEGRYAIKDLYAFVHAVENEEYVTYGKYLSFTHFRRAFDDASQANLRFLQRAVTMRQQLEAPATNHAYANHLPAASALSLSDPELVELLQLNAARPFRVEDRTHVRQLSMRSHVVQGDPPVQLVFERAGADGYVLGAGQLPVLIEFSDECYAFWNGNFYHCTQEFHACAPLLRGMLDWADELQFLGEADVAQFAANVLPVLEQALEVVVPEELEKMRPRPCEVEVLCDREGRGCVFEAYARYDDERCPLLEDDAARMRLSWGLRNENAESSVRDLLFPYISDRSDLPVGTQQDPVRVSGDERVAEFLHDVLPRLREHAHVFTTPSFDALISSKRPQITTGLSIRANLINIKLRSDDLSREEIADILGSYRKKRRYHRMRDGSFLDLETTNIAQIDEGLSELGFARNVPLDELALPRYRAFQLDALLEQCEQDVSFSSYLASFENAKATAHEVPATLRAVLRPYQVEGFSWLCALCDLGLGGILADEMGLGKSVQLIAMLLERKQRAQEALGEQVTQGVEAAPGVRGEQDASEAPEGAMRRLSLIVCPASLVYNWVEEFEKFAKQMQVVAVAGNKAQRREVLEGIAAGTMRADVLVTSYDLFRRDVELYKPLSLDVMALDEAQYIKNQATLAARSVKSVAAEHRIALTGTPIENRLSELWSIFDFLMPGFLGSYMRFRERYERPVLDGDERAAERLQAITGRFILRRIKKEVLQELPDKTVNLVYSHFGSEQERLYRALEQNLRDHVRSMSRGELGDERIEVLAELMKLRELCCDPALVYDDYTGNSAKIDTIADLVESACSSGKKMLIFSQFTSFLSRIAACLDAAKVSHFTITGTTPKKRRQELVNTFNADDTSVFLVSLKAGGAGLNLTGASVVIHADPWWNLAAENQATDRAHRIGQTNDVTVYKVIAKGTIEERVAALQEEKGKLAEKFVAGGAAASGMLTKEDLLALLAD